jgi:alkaline phosphatase
MKKLTSVLLAVLILCAALVPCVGAKDAKTYANVILMIGDGMGENHLELAKQERGISLFMEDQCDLRGYSKTRSHSSAVTDSAAGGTALSSGVRTTNRYVASFWYDPLCWFSVPRTLAEAAKLSGRRAGVVTTDKTDGATPASFTAHTSDRGNSTDISTQQATSDFDLIWGGAVDTFDADLAAQNDFTVVTSKREMDALQSGSKSFGQFDYNWMWRTKVHDGATAPTLSQMTEKAIELLQNDKGFFLMVEGAHIDKWSHTSNDADNYATKVANAAEAVEEFDNAIEVAANYAKKDGNTLIVITADHETGGLTLIDGKYTYTKTSHTGADVPVIVFGSDDFIANGDHIENRQVAQRIGAKMGLDRFPASDAGKITAYFRTLLQGFRLGFDADHAKNIWNLTRDLLANLFPKKG